MRKAMLTAAVVCALLWAHQACCATFNVTTAAEFQTALTSAQANGENDTINVAAGTYNIAASLTYETTQNNDLTIVGAGAATTILDGGSSIQIMRITGEGNGDVSISELTLQHGRVGTADGFGGALFINNSGGGAITVDSCTATDSTAYRNTGGAWLGAVNGDITVTNSSFTHNTCDDGTSDDGCGLYLYFDSTTATGSAIVRNNDISNNTLQRNPAPVGNCDGAGAIIYHLGTDSTAPSITVENNSVNNNMSYEGVAGLSLHVLHRQAVVTFSGNTFSGNVAGPLPAGVPIQITGAGLDIYNDGGTITVTGNTFLDNINHDPYGNGGGLCLDDFPSGTLSMTRNVFAGNQNGGIGGGAIVNLGSGVTSAVIAGNLFVDNQAGVGTSEGSGGGLSLGSDIDVTLANNTFYGNTADDAGALGYYAEAAGSIASLANEIYRGNTPNAISVFGAGPVQATYSNIQGGSGESYFGTGCIDADPLFYNAASPAGADTVYATSDDGLHLTAASPSADAGSSAAVPAALGTDVAGQARILGDAVDMGAYEAEAGSSIITTTTSVSTTTTTVAGRCPFARNAAAGVPVHDLRRLRDQRLPTAFGAVLAAMYYQNMAEVGAILQKNTSLRGTFLMLTRGALPQVKVLFCEGTAVIPAGDLERMRAFLIKLQDNASPKLRMDIDVILSGMETGWLLQGLGITTG